MSNTTARLHFKVMPCQPHVRLLLRGPKLEEFQSWREGQKKERLKRIAIE